MKIGSREIGPGHSTYIIGEVGLAHDGSVNRAHEFIDAIADAGASAVKFQCYMTPRTDEEWRVEPTYQAYSPESRHDYRKRTAFTKATWHALAAHCSNRQVDFLASPFDMEAFEILSPLVPAWKVASGQITNLPMLIEMAKTALPILISTGMCTTWERDEAMAIVKDSPFLFMQCTSEYPCRPEHVGLRSFEGIYRGLSDHSGTIYAGLAAVALGASVVEVHVKLSGFDNGLDASSSLMPHELHSLVMGCNFIRQALKPVNKDVMSSELGEMRRLFLYKESNG